VNNFKWLKFYEVLDIVNFDCDNMLHERRRTWIQNYVISMLCACESPPINFWMPKPIFIKLSTYIMAHLKGALYKSLASMCVLVCFTPLSLLGNSSVTHFCANEYTQQYKNCWSRRFLCCPCHIKGESVNLYISLSLLGNGSVNTFPRQWRIVVGVVFSVVHVISKKSRWLVLPKTSCL
jgi:hypothetical protein